MPKGGAAIEEHVLFGKYRLCRKLGAGRSGTVYLAYHTELEEYRAVKIVPKTMADYETFKKEALFLKTLRHPGIPLVYDVEEDLTNSYLIEEYLEGESLYALVKRLGSLSMKTALEIGIQTCRLIQFMNTSDNPILYLDLQPKNLLVCNGIVRLIDFDHAQYAEDVTSFGERYGTIGFAAPEQYLGEALDCRTDVYAIGALLYFMCRGEPPGMSGASPASGGARDIDRVIDWDIGRDIDRDRGRGIARDLDWDIGRDIDRNLDRVIRGCMAQKKEERYQNAGELEQALCELKAGISKEHAIKPLNIVFAGARQGIGTTHAALGMSNFLTRNGYPALYQEAYDTDAVRTLVRNTKAKADDTGIYHIGALSLRPYYGGSVKMPYRYFPAVVKDAGSTWKESTGFPDADFYVLVCGGKWWETDHTLRAARYFKERGKLLLLFNHMAGDFSLKLPEDLRGLPSFYLPFFANPLGRDKAADTCFGEMLESGTGGKNGWRRRRNKSFWRKSRG